jgi:CRISPR system Cascade subunit CasA
MGETETGKNFTFNLWREPWITLERAKGPPVLISLEQALLQAHEFTSIYDSSPLVVVGVQRLLVAILQAALEPQSYDDLRRLWHTGRFPEEKLLAFGALYGGRFDLFSESEPFLQSGDLSLHPQKGDNVKTPAYLTPEIPSGTGVIHYRHVVEKDYALCPVCAARGLVTIPCFATSGGAGIKPSINGVPPIYVLPGGETLFQALAAALIPAGKPYRPAAASIQHDRAWWNRPALVQDEEVIEVGYLHSLTFPARRVRLHPSQDRLSCTRCGGQSEVAVRSMVFDMGESRPKDGAAWLDPFAAYSQDVKGGKPPVPIRPTEGKVLWREFSSLFLPQTSADDEKRKFLRPGILAQIALENIGEDRAYYPFRCIGMRTDMKAKIFEWIEAGFDVPRALLNDEEAGVQAREAIRFAEACGGSIQKTFRSSFGGKSEKSERFKDLKDRMMANYWAGLAEPFRNFILGLAEPAKHKGVVHGWAETVTQHARRTFDLAAEQTGDSAEALRRQASGKSINARWLGKLRKDYIEKGESA